MPRGHLKAQSLDSTVVTPTGIRRFGDLVVGDSVIGSDGRPTTVTITHPVSDMDLYRVTTSDGRSTLVNLEHLWTVTIPSNSQKTVTLTTKELLTKYQTPRYDKRTGANYIENRVRIKPVRVMGVEDPTLPIDPYTLGVWLGDGNSTDSRFTCHDDDSAIVERIGCYKNATKYCWTLPGLVTTLRATGLYKNKHIPEQYFTASYEQRQELLRGLMDTDGTCSKTGLPSFTNSNPRLMEDFVRLVRSLGGVAHVCSFMTSYPGSSKQFPTQTANIWVHDNPFWLERKTTRWIKPKRIQLVISDIQLERRGLGRCITVANPDGIYLTDGYLPTHNSTVCSVLYVLWRIYRNPDIRVLVGTNIKRLGRSFIRELRQYFENGDLQREVWNTRPWCPGPLVPAMSAADRRKRNSQRNNDEYDEETLADDTKLIWSMEALQVNRPTVLKEPTVLVASIGTTVTGDHYDLILLDDIVDFDNSDSQRKADTILDWTRDLESVLDPRQEVKHRVGNHTLLDYVGDECLILGTRYYEWDYYGYLLEEAVQLGVKSFVRNIYNNGVDETDGYLWPERFNQSVLDQIRRRINHHQRFASQYLNAILAPEDCLFSLDAIKWFQSSTVHHLSDNTWEVSIRGEPAKRIKPMLFLDPAATVKDSSDFSVLTVGGYSENKELVILDVQNGRWTPTEVCERIFAMCEEWSINSVTVEMVAGFKLYDHIIREHMKRTGRIIGIRDYKPVSKLNKAARIEGILQPLFTNGSIYLNADLSGNQELRNEITAFPRSRHDDIIDTIAAIAEIGQPTRKSGAKGAYNPRRVVNHKWGGSRA